MLQMIRLPVSFALRNLVDIATIALYFKINVLPEWCGHQKANAPPPPPSMPDSDTLTLSTFCYVTVLL